MSRTALSALAIVAVSSAAPALSAERQTTVAREAYACDSWAAWREYGQASLTQRGARASGACPIRLAPETRVTVIDNDAGEGAAEIRHGGRMWFVDEQRLR